MEIKRQTVPDFILEIKNVWKPKNFERIGFLSNYHFKDKDDKTVDSKESVAIGK